MVELTNMDVESKMVDGSETKQPSEKELRKLQQKAEKELKKQQREAEECARIEGAKAILAKKATSYEESHGFVGEEGEWSVRESWMSLRALSYEREKDISDSWVGRVVWYRGRIATSRGKGNLVFLQLRSSGGLTCQALSDAAAAWCELGKDGSKWLAALPVESVVDVMAELVVPEVPIQSSHEKRVELRLKKVFCVSKGPQVLPFQLRDANRAPLPTNITEDEDIVDVGDAQANVLLDVRLDHRVLDLRGTLSQSVFRLQCMAVDLFRQFFRTYRFTEIHSPKLIGGSSEGGANVFTLKYFNKDGCLAQSPQLYKQMAIAGDFERVFEIGPVFRAENSNTHRHLCEFTGVDFEMELHNSLPELLDMAEDLFNFVLKGLSQVGAKLVEAIAPYLPNKEKFVMPARNKSLRFTFEEACRILKESGDEGVPENLSNFDFSTTQEKKLGVLVKEKYNTDFYLISRYPLAARPFYTMPAPDAPRKWTNSFDIFMRGEEIVSGAQRIHEPALLKKRAIECGIDPASIKGYLDCFGLGCPPHGGLGIGLERVVMLFLGLPNIRYASLFPRDPKRLAP